MITAARFCAALLILHSSAGRPWQFQAARAGGDGSAASGVVSQRDDPRRADAEQLTNDALRLRQQGTAESLEASTKTFAQAVARWREIGDPHGLAVALRGLAVNQRMLGRPSDAVAALAEAVSLLKDDPGARAAALSELGSAKYVGGDPNGALDVLRDALAGLRQAHDVPSEARTLNNIGTVLLNLGRVHEALAAYQESLEKADPADAPARANTVSNIGSARLRREMGNGNDEADTLMHLSDVYERLGDRSRAVETGERALQLMQQARNPRGEGEALSGVAALRCAAPAAILPARSRTSSVPRSSRATRTTPPARFARLPGSGPRAVRGQDPPRAILQRSR